MEVSLFSNFLNIIVEIRTKTKIIEKIETKRFSL